MVFKLRQPGSRVHILNHYSNLPCLKTEGLEAGVGGGHDESKIETKRESLPDVLGEPEEFWGLWETWGED